jgi:hypothetical protein
MKDAVTIILWACLFPTLLALAGFGAMLAWNLAMPELFGLKEATHFNGVGLALLAMFLQSPPRIGVK